MADRSPPPGPHRRRRAAVVGCALAIVMLAALTPVSARAAISWRPSGSLGSQPPATPVGLACPLATRCVTLAGGGEVSFDPTAPAPGTPVDLGLPAERGAGAGDAGGGASRVACPSAGGCVAIAASAGGSRVAGFDPDAASAARVTDGPALSPVALTCPSADLCVAAGSGGAGGAVAAFDPSAPGSQAVFGPGSSEPYAAVACPSARICVAVGGTDATTFDPSAPGGSGAPGESGVGGTTTIDAGGALTGVACADEQHCAAVDDHGQAVTFTPGQPAPVGRAELGAHPLTAVSCPAVGACVAVDAAGGATSFSAAGVPSPVARQTVAAGPLGALACGADGRCTALGPAGTELSFAAAGSGSGTGSGSGSLPAATPVVRGVSANGLACPAASACVAVRVSADGQVSRVRFDPAAPAVATAWPLALSGGPGALVCPSASLCVAGDGAGHAVAFDPGLPGGRAIAVPPGAGPHGLACPDVHHCTAVGGADQLTFDPASGRTLSARTIDTVAPLDAVACPAATQCTAGDAAGGVITFDAAAPQTPARRASGLPAVTALDCPAGQRCVAVAGADAVSFDPTSPATPAAVALDPDGALSAIDCQSASRCYLADGSGRAVELDPARPAAATALALPGASGVGGLSCPAVGRCVFADAVGRVLVGEEAIAPSLAGGSAPTVHGRLRAGGRLVGRPGRWLATGPLRFAYRWLRCARRCRAIPGATHRVYRVRRGDRGRRLRLLVTAVNAAGRARGRSDRYGPILGPYAGRARVRRALRALVAPRGASVSRLLSHRVVRLPFRAPEGGRIAVVWTLGRGSRPAVVARGRAAPPAAGRARCTLGLTARGRRLLRAAPAPVTVTVRVRFTVLEGPTVRVSGHRRLSR